MANGWRNRQAGQFPPVTAEVRPADYRNDLDRGTVEYDPRWRNYSFHKVTIPRGARLVGCNFAQVAPDTPALTVAGNDATFEDCNLVNVRVDAGWKLVRCNTVQAWLVTRNGDQKRQWICKHPSELTGSETEPANVIRA